MTGPVRVPSLLLLASGLILGAMFPIETRAASSTMAERSRQGMGGSSMREPQSGSLLVEYYEGFLRDRDLDQFRDHVLARYTEGTLGRMLTASPSVTARRAAVLALGVIPGNRKPSTGMAWLILVLAVPYLGIVAFALFGSTSVGRKRRAWQRQVNAEVMAAARAQGDAAALTPAGDLAGAARLNEVLGSLPMSEGNRVAVLADYSGAVEAMREEVVKASTFVHVEFYITIRDATTAPFFAALGRAVERGVTVRLLLDHMGTRPYPGYRKTLRALTEVGVLWHLMLPVQPLKGRWQRPDLRNHRKLMVVDGDVGAMVELKCETDFVAGSDQFKSEADALAKLVAAEGVDATASRASNLDDLKITLKENIDLGRVVRLEAGAGEIIDSYLHVQGGRGVNGVLVVVKDGSVELAHDIAVHIAFARPKYLATDDVPADEVAAERVTLENITRNEGKPEQAIPKIVDGRLQGYFKTVCLLEQPFAKDDKVQIKDLLGDAKVVRWAQVEIG